MQSQRPQSSTQGAPLRDVHGASVPAELLGSLGSLGGGRTRRLSFFRPQGYAQGARG